ncbi:MAG: hypothetical protein WDW36_009259 [Sanguina aurantia]
MAKKQVEADVGEETEHTLEPTPSAAAEAVPAVGAASMRESTLEQGAIEEDGVYRARKETVPEETASYLTDIIKHFKTLIDDEEKQLLVGNVLEEIAGKELGIASDSACSRHVELLLGSAQPQQLIQFLTSIVEQDGFVLLASGPFGSHVLEKALVRLEGQLDGMAEAEYDSFAALIKTLCEALMGQLYPFITDKFATHVARRLLCLAAGRNVLPAASKAQQASGKANHKGAHHSSSLATRTAISSAPYARKSAPSGPAQPPPFSIAAGVPPQPQRFPDLVAALVEALSGGEFKGACMQELVSHPYASPFLQGLLTACAGDRAPLSQLVPVVLGATVCDDASKAGKLLSGVAAARVEAMVMDACASRVMEVLLAVAHKVGTRRRGSGAPMLSPSNLGRVARSWSTNAGGSIAFDVEELERRGPGGPRHRDPGATPPPPPPPACPHQPLLDELFDRFMRGQLLSLAHHPSANFVVQAALAAAHSKEQVKSMFEELQASLGELLRKRRSGVVAALVAACGRTGACQKEVCATLATALTGAAAAATLQQAGAGGGADDAQTIAQLAPALLSLDAPCDLGSNSAPGSSQGPRLSTLGATMLTNVLSFGQGAARAFTDSVAGLRQHDAARVARDPSGSRCLEALLSGSAPPKVKERLLTALTGSFGHVSLTAPGSYLVEACYSFGAAALKEKIVSELSASQRAVESTHWGPGLCRKLGVDAYTRDPEQWRRHAVSDTKTAAAFEKLFGNTTDNGAAAEGAPASKRQRKQQEESAAAAAAATDGGGEAGEQGAGEEVKQVFGKKGRKLARQAAAELLEQQRQQEGGGVGAGGGVETAAAAAAAEEGGEQ